MHIFTKISDVKSFLNDYKNINTGFVPTMGALHQGHAALIQKSVSENALTITSIFVNPTQFNNSNDFDKYPITLDKDIEILKQKKCDVLFLPSVQEMYPSGLKTLDIQLGSIAQVMEGAYRPGHFEGVITIVDALFGIIKPNRAYFGEKDFQQLAIIKYMSSGLYPDIEIIGCPTIREQDGLAMSSRNMRLSNEQRQNASLLYNVLMECVNNFQILSVQELENRAKQRITDHVMFSLDYFTIANSETLQPVQNKSEKVRAFVAAYMGDVRLIDNMPLN